MYTLLNFTYSGSPYRGHKIHFVAKNTFGNPIKWTVDDIHIPQLDTFTSLTRAFNEVGLHKVTLEVNGEKITKEITILQPTYKDIQTLAGTFTFARSENVKYGSLDTTYYYSDTILTVSVIDGSTLRFLGHTYSYIDTNMLTSGSSIGVIGTDTSTEATFVGGFWAYGGTYMDYYHKEDRLVFYMLSVSKGLGGFTRFLYTRK
jgi:hypothetical protein